MIITEISKEVENNDIVRLSMYPRQYVFRGVRGGEPGTRVEMVTLEIHGHIQEVVVLEVVKLTPIFLIFVVEKQLLRDTGDPIMFLEFHFLSFLLPSL